MQIDDMLNLPEIIDIEYLKNNITEDQLLLLYSYIVHNEDEFTNEQLSVLYEFLYEIDNKLKEEDDEDEIDTIHS